MLFKLNTIIINVRKENLINICDYMDSITCLRIIKNKFFIDKKFKVVAIVRSIDMIKGMRKYIQSSRIYSNNL